SNDARLLKMYRYMRTLVGWSRPDASKAIAVGASTLSSQPASPETTRSSAMPCRVSWIAVSWKSAGVGAGGVVSTKLQAATATAANRTKQSASGRMGDIEPEATTGELQPPSAGERSCAATVASDLGRGVSRHAAGTSYLEL